MALSPEHPLAQELAKNDPKLAAFIEECRHVGTAEADIEKAEKKGYDTGLTAAHPFDAGWKLPVSCGPPVTLESIVETEDS